jgi:hypothetical protein
MNKKYITNASIWIGGIEYAAGSEIYLNDKQAKYIRHALDTPEEAAAKTVTAPDVLPEEAVVAGDPDLSLGVDEVRPLKRRRDQ